jgi:hypothetical protein
MSARYSPVVLAAVAVIAAGCSSTTAVDPGSHAIATPSTTLVSQLISEATGAECSVFGTVYTQVQSDFTTVAGSAAVV